MFQPFHQKVNPLLLCKSESFNVLFGSFYCDQASKGHIQNRSNNIKGKNVLVDIQDALGY